MQKIAVTKSKKYLHMLVGTLDSRIIALSNVPTVPIVLARRRSLRLLALILRKNNGLQNEKTGQILFGETLSGEYAQDRLPSSEASLVFQVGS